MKILVLLPFLFPSLRLGEDEKKEVKLQGFDVVTAPVQAIELRAKLEHKGMLGIHPNIHKEELIFKWGEKELGRATTKDEGIASLTWPLPKDAALPFQEYELRVIVAPNPKFESTSTSLRVFVRDPKRPVLVLDLDGTVCASKEVDVGLKDPKEIKCIEGSVEALQALSKDYDLIYLTGRDEAFINRTREWLDFSKFPHGPILVRDLGLFNLSAKKYKTERLLQLKKEFNLVAGAGDREEDAEAYMAAGMEAYLIGREKNPPKGTHLMSGWAEIAKALKKP